MNRENSDATSGQAGKQQGKLENLAQTINPPSREISDEELADPGANIPRKPMDQLDESRAPRTRR
ncbi:MAG TPA: hypothetical protein VIM12_12735 [Noviherbaspirillum sp.]|jgi:hypothetical protein|uniref:hypothetical protein n=1 Tax=Noviherbaspirillum sp. TaxID=1926288 RepID=UPI002F941FA8